MRRGNKEKRQVVQIQELGVAIFVGQWWFKNMADLRFGEK